jgi:hypothetical protein
MKSLLILSALLAVITAPAAAQQPAPEPAPAPTPASPAAQCWEVVALAQGSASGSMLKLNKCTGDTWMLLKVQLPRPSEKDAKSKPDAAATPNARDVQSKDTEGPPTHTFRWRRLMQDDTGEAVLVSRAP